jgi:hypothetical protein
VNLAYKRLLALLHRTTQSLSVLINQGIDFHRLNSLTPVFGTLMELYAGL